MLYERRRWRRRSTPNLRRSLNASASGSGSSDCCRGSGDTSSSFREGVRNKARIRRAASRSLREFWQLDGTTSDVVLACHLPQDDAVVRQLSFFETRRHAVMDGIRQRIAGLRTRAETAPGRLEWSD